jgi:hypothetical protein
MRGPLLRQPDVEANPTPKPTGGILRLRISGP